MRYMKIGILTYWWSNDNYGQLLQCFALQKYLQDKGHDAFLVRYHPMNDGRQMTIKERLLFSINHPFRTFGIIYKKLMKKTTPACTAEEVMDRKFNHFRNKFIISTKTVFTSYKELKESYPKADMYIVGSDQIWNIDNEYATNTIDAWFLNFLPEEIIRCSYAASFGRGKLSYAVGKKLKSRLKKFSVVTVRENSGKKICKKMRISAEVVCDPTLLLPCDYYKFISSEVVPLKKRYVFLYMLSNTCVFSVRKFSEWAKDSGLDIVYVSGNSGWKKCNYDDADIKKTNLTILEWLSYLANAEYVVTNSFHCTLFSLLFERKIAVVPLKGSVKNTNDRIESLFLNLNVSKTTIENNDFSVLKDLQPQKIDNNFIKKSKNILDSFTREL